jgi:hypothetical protein
MANHFMKPSKPLKTLEEAFSLPPGSFAKHIAEREELQRKIAEHQVACIRAHRAGLPRPELGFEVELWMIV